MQLKELGKCKTGNHSFLITKWYVRGGHQEAVEVRCSHCLCKINIESLEMAEMQGLKNESESKS